MLRGKSRLLQSSCPWTQIPRGMKKRIRFGRATSRCISVAAVGHMLGAACIQLAVYAVLTYDCIYPNEWIQ